MCVLDNKEQFYFHLSSLSTECSWLTDAICGNQLYSHLHPLTSSYIKRETALLFRFHWWHAGCRLRAAGCSLAAPGFPLNPPNPVNPSQFSSLTIYCSTSPPAVVVFLTTIPYQHEHNHYFSLHTIAELQPPVFLTTTPSSCQLDHHYFPCTTNPPVSGSQEQDTIAFLQPTKLQDDPKQL